MPRRYVRKPGSRHYADYSAETLSMCLASIRNGSMTTRAAEALFNIPRRTILNKLKGKHTYKPGKQPIFNVEEERIFVECVNILSQFGFPIVEFDLRCLIYDYLGRSGRKVRQFTNNFPGKEWVRGFLKRNKDLTLRFAVNIEKARATVNPANLIEYINNLKQTIENVPCENIWNYNEINLSDDPTATKIISRRGVKHPENIRNASEASISLMMCGSASGELLAPYAVYKSESMCPSWCQGGLTDCKYGYSQSGWFTVDTFTDWFESLLLPKLKNLEGKKVLIGDNFSSHITEYILSLCREYNICFVCLPPKSSHLTQPLDVVFFHPMKVTWKKILSSYRQSEADSQSAALQKEHFPLLLKILMTMLCMNAAPNLKVGFHECGIVPCDVNILLKRLPSEKCEKNSVENGFLEYFEGNEDVINNL